MSDRGKAPNNVGSDSSDIDGDFREEEGSTMKARPSTSELKRRKYVKGEQHKICYPTIIYLPIFGVDYNIQYDWTVDGLFSDPPVNQRDHDICGSIVFTHLSQAWFNKNTPTAEQRLLSYQNLAHHIQSITRRSGFEFRNLQIDIRYIRDNGLLSGNKITGLDGTTQREFQQREDVDNQFIYALLDTGRVVL